MSDRYRYETVNGKLQTILRVTEPWRQHWWQFWRKPLRDREYLIEPFSGRMTPLPSPSKQVLKELWRRIWRVLRGELVGAIFFTLGCAYGGILASSLGPPLYAAITRLI